jgi:hypothetical protein
MVGFMATDPTNELADAMEASWKRFRDPAARLRPDDLERPTLAGWTAKEMLAHVAFWEEATEPVIVAMFRGQSLPSDWAFGSGYTHESGEWPRADVHNAREAAWARDRSSAEVLARLDRAHATALRIVRSLTDEECKSARYRDYIGVKTSHYEEHLPELEALVD